jgi:hypothetical protein
MLSSDDRALVEEFRKERRHYVFLGSGFDGEYTIAVDGTLLYSGKLSTAPSTGLVAVDLSFIHPYSRPILMHISRIGTFSIDAPIYPQYAYVYVDIRLPNCIRFYHTNRWQLRE